MSRREASISGPWWPILSWMSWNSSDRRAKLTALPGVVHEARERVSNDDPARDAFGTRRSEASVDTPGNASVWPADRRVPAHPGKIATMATGSMPRAAHTSRLGAFQEDRRATAEPRWQGYGNEMAVRVTSEADPDTWCEGLSPDYPLERYFRACTGADDRRGDDRDTQARGGPSVLGLSAFQ